MNEQIDAIYDNGVLKPLRPLVLPDQARVKVSIDRQLGGDSSELGIPAGSTDAEFDAQLEALLFDGPSLPPDFSRADIYADHD